VRLSTNTFRNLSHVGIFYSHYEHNQRAASLDIHSIISNMDAMAQMAYGGGIPSMAMMAGTAQSIPKIIELWHEQPTCYLAWCVALLVSTSS
jgi:hypothetical protein